MRVVIIGAGSFGTAIARHIATMECGTFDDVALWCRSEDQSRAISLTSRNPRALSEYELPKNITAFGGERSLTALLSTERHIVLAVPAQSAGEMMRRIAVDIPEGEGARVMCLAKGIEISSAFLMHELAARHIPKASYTALSGPSHAEEVVRGAPSAIVAASKDEASAREWQAALNDRRLRVYTTSDVVGVELGGAIKNVIAIAVGIARASGFGDNSIAALVTRGLAEIMRYGAALGAEPITLAGLAGIGDLMVTCYSDLSRNLRFGKFVGGGKSVDEAAREIGETVEGMHTVRAIFESGIARRLDMPLAEGVRRILYDGASVREVMTSLMDREPKSETVRA